VIIEEDDVILHAHTHYYVYTYTHEHVYTYMYTHAHTQTLTFIHSYLKARRHTKRDTSCVAISSKTRFRRCQVASIPTEAFSFFVKSFGEYSDSAWR
jgi:hypothetical protein